MTTVSEFNGGNGPPVTAAVWLEQASGRSAAVAGTVIVSATAKASVRLSGVHKDARIYSSMRSEALSPSILCLVVMLQFDRTLL